MNRFWEDIFFFLVDNDLSRLVVISVGNNIHVLVLVPYIFSLVFETVSSSSLFWIYVVFSTLLTYFGGRLRTLLVIVSRFLGFF